MLGRVKSFNGRRRPSVGGWHHSIGRDPRGCMGAMAQQNLRGSLCQQARNGRSSEPRRMRCSRNLLNAHCTSAMMIMLAHAVHDHYFYYFYRFQDVGAVARLGAWAAMARVCRELSGSSRHRIHQGARSP